MLNTQKKTKNWSFFSKSCPEDDIFCRFTINLYLSKNIFFSTYASAILLFMQHLEKNKALHHKNEKVADFFLKM